MNIAQVDYNRIRSLSHTDLAYINHDPALRPFYQYEASLAQLKDVIDERKKHSIDRPRLLDALQRQYTALGAELPTGAAQLAAENTFTVTTAHQPLLLTGPLYHIYKIASVINLARQINAEYTDQVTLPVFVIGSEDHDWDELNHFHLFGKKQVWEKETGGPAGRFDIEGLAVIIETVADKILNEQYGSELIGLLREAHDRATTYAQFHQALLIALFGKHGLVVLNMDDAELKRAFIPVMRKELVEQFSHKHVTPSQQSLEKQGFKPQAHCRELNLFYLSPGRRERIELIGDEYVLVESGRRFSTDEMLAELENHPESFSPNVIMRPLYQEFTLPNLAYIGGGGEVAYWLERKTQFAAAGIPYPMIVRRNSLLLIDENTKGQIEKADLAWEDLLDDYDAIVKKYLLSHSNGDLNAEAELQLIRQAYEALANKATHIDPTLSTAIQAEEQKQLKQFEQLSTRLLRAAKHNEENSLKRIQRLKEKLFPGNGLQERYDNVIPYYAVHGDALLTQLIEICNPFDERFTAVML
jgi:bacillithiol biosynthesis cysteine-adding enzyme BshC